MEGQPLGGRTQWCWVRGRNPLQCLYFSRTQAHEHYNGTETIVTKASVMHKVVHQPNNDIISQTTGIRHGLQPEYGKSENPNATEANEFIASMAVDTPVPVTLGAGLASLKIRHALQKLYQVVG